MEARKINITNHNNVLACNVFATINFAPVREQMPKLEDLEKQVYVVENDGQLMHCQLLEIALYKFKHMPDHITLFTNGTHGDEWRRHWLAKQPQTTNDSPMAVYYYKKIDAPPS